jgi:RNA polymerase sigma-70 factor (ECF subfamily)
MFAVCLRYCANYEEAKDVLHDGFITVFTKIGQFHHAGSFEGWARRIFVNHAIERYRNHVKLPITSVTDDADAHFIAPDAEDEPEAYQLSEAELLALIDGLPHRYKTVFNLYVMDSLSHKEIGDALGISEGTSRSYLMRARSILQKQVNDLIDTLSYNKNNASERQLS